MAKTVKFIEAPCETCGELFKSKMKWASHRRFAHRWDGVAFNDVPIGEKKRRLKLEQNDACAVCKNTVWQGKPIPLELDHINGDPNDECKENLQFICPNCHAQTDTYCGKNVGRPRSKREEKSYPNYRDPAYTSTALKRMRDSDADEYLTNFLSADRTNRHWVKNLMTVTSLTQKQVRRFYRLFLAQGYLTEL
jgi:5-methylcytosine-specific restriction endonuclease McrA